MDTKHTPTPWWLWQDSEGCCALRQSLILSEPPEPKTKFTGRVIVTEGTNINAAEDHARIVLCVNSCANDGLVVLALKSARAALDSSAGWEEKLKAKAKIETTLRALGAQP